MTLSEYLRDCAQKGLKLYNAKVKYNNHFEYLNCIEFFRYKDYSVDSVYKSITNKDNFYVIKLSKEVE